MLCLGTALMSDGVRLAAPFQGDCHFDTSRLIFTLLQFTAADRNQIIQKKKKKNTVDPLLSTVKSCILFLSC